MKSTARLITEYRRAAIALGKRKLEVERKIANIGRLERELDSITFEMVQSPTSVMRDEDVRRRAILRHRRLDAMPEYPIYDRDGRADSNIA